MVELRPGFVGAELRGWEDDGVEDDVVFAEELVELDVLRIAPPLFPATQLGTHEPWTKLHHLSSTEYLTYEGGKFSKSRGIGVFGDSAQKTGVASDIWRFFLASHRPESSDTEFTWDAFISDNNNLLLKNLGNLVSRVLKFVNSPNYDNVIPAWTYHEPSFDAFKDTINDLLARYIQDLDAVKLRAGVSTVLAISQQGNGFLQSHKLDGNLFRNEPAKCAAVIGLAVNLVHLLAALLAPYMPDTAGSINQQLCVDLLPIPDRWDADSIGGGHRIGKARHLFRPIDPEKAGEWRGLFGAEGGGKGKGRKGKGGDGKKVVKGGDSVTGDLPK